MDTCQEVIATRHDPVSPSKQVCYSCGAKGRLTHKYELHEHDLPDGLAGLPYFRRLLHYTKGLKLCAKCMVILNFSKIFYAAIAPHIIDPLPALRPSVAAAFQILAKEATPPSPRQPLIVKLAVSAKETAVAKERNVDDTDFFPESIKLPKGLKLGDLTCFVAVERLRVPPIKIRALKLQSIMKTKSPDKTKKRVSFSNSHSIAEIPARKQRLESSSSSSTSSKGSPSTEESSELEIRRGKRLRGRGTVNYSNRYLYTSSESPSSSSSEEEIKVQPKLRSRIVARRASFMEPPSTSSSDDEEDNQPLKRFKASLPEKPRTPKPISPAKSPSLAVEPEMYREQGLVNGHSSPSPSPSRANLLENSPIKRKLFTENGSSRPSLEKPAAEKQRPTRSSSRKSSMSSSQPTPPPFDPKPDISSESPRRRISVDSVATNFINDSPMKISGRRKTMGASQADAHPQPPLYGRVRVVSIDKLRAPDPQVDLLLANMRSQTYLPHPFMTTP